MSVLDYGADLISPGHLRIAQDQHKRLRSKIEQMVRNKQLPETGFNSAQVEQIVTEFANCDTNNFVGKVGAGEREGRVFSSLVSQRHYNLSHGIGRSGNISDAQPKAAGSSMISTLTDHLALDAVRVAGVKGLKSCLVVPMATGMALRECLLALKLERPAATHVIWPRIDQKSCLKSMLSLGLTVHVIEPVVSDKGLTTNKAAIEMKINEVGAETILAVHTTISCFAPRQPDSVEAVALLCDKLNIPHVINGAYFLQSRKSVNVLNAALGTNRRVDAVVMSTDKNFMTPVGGALICSPEKKDKSLAIKVARNYPGRASMSPKLDLFITLLEMGKCGYRQLLEEQNRNYEQVLSRLEQLNMIRVIASNGISIAISLDKFEGDVKSIGSMLFTRNVSGPRVVTCTDKKQIGSLQFERFGCSSNSFNQPYLALAVAIGMNENEPADLVDKIVSVLKEYNKQAN